MISFIKNFRRDDSGAVTVDWVVLTAGIVGLAVGAFAVIESNSARIAGETAGLMSTQEGRLATVTETVLE
ncbi:MAG: hypothetical protein GY878_06900 [Fuerstiella sp.]|nr:hypothetical protein [Fuerstiella sp.]